jgi:hypothetical protein
MSLHHFRFQVIWVHVGSDFGSSDIRESLVVSSRAKPGRVEFQVIRL